MTKEINDRNIENRCSGGATRSVDFWERVSILDLGVTHGWILKLLRIGRSTVDKFFLNVSEL